MYLHQIKTKAQLDKLKHNIERFKLDVHKSTGTKLEKILDESYDYEFINLMEDVLGHHKEVSENTKVHMAKSIKALEQDLEGVQVLGLTLAFVPTTAFLTKIHNWVRENSGSGRVVFELKHDPQILGGALLTFGGVFKNYSLLKKLEDYKFIS